ncbi:MAG: hypothetical protein GY757_59095 [bacterium]|nr:hypothetical protein [bacterium]
MNKFKLSLIYIVCLVVVSYLHRPLHTLILKASAGNIFYYLIYGLFVSFFVVVLLKTVKTGRNREIAVLLLIAGQVFFFLFSTPMFLFKLTILEFFILGLIVAFESKKAKTPIPFFILFAGASLAEIASNLWLGSSFNYLDVWVNALSGLSGYVAGFLLL